MVMDAVMLAGRYRLIDPVGRGGEDGRPTEGRRWPPEAEGSQAAENGAEVWRADDLALGRPVAIRLLDPEGPAGGGSAEMVWQEARNSARLVHPNVVAVYDVGSDGDRLFLVTEWVQGRDLGALLRERGPFPPAEAARIGAQAARALAAAHAAGIVHRDVKPGNLLLTADGVVKLADFGIAGPADPQGGAPGNRTVAIAPKVVGTPAYLSPEQASGQPAGPASDLYALGCVLYELLVGRPPFSGEEPAAVLRRHVEEAPVPPRLLRPEVTSSLEQVILGLLRKDPAQRPADAERVAGALESVAGGKPHRGVAELMNATQVLPTLAPAERAYALRSGFGHALAWQGERPLAAAALMAVAALVVVASGLAVLESGGDTPAAAPGPSLTSEPTSSAAAPTPSLKHGSADGRTRLNRQPRQRQSPTVLLAALDQRLKEQAAAGRLDPKVARDIRKKLREIARKIAEGKRQEAAGKVGEVRQKLAEAARQGRWTPDATVGSLLDRLSRSL
jgi:eukaryotic-like serine/threonine-protein kinase